MRTTLTIDDDVLAAARDLSSQSGKALGAVVSELSRAGLEAARRPVRSAGRVPMFAPRPGAAPITSEAVNEARDSE